MLRASKGWGWPGSSRPTLHPGNCFHILTLRMLYWTRNPGPEACKANTLQPSCAPGHTHVLYHLSLPTFFGWGHYLVPLVRNQSKDQDLMPPSWCLVKLWFHPRPKPNRDSRTALFRDPQPRTTAMPVKKRLLSDYNGAVLTSMHRQAKHSSELNHLSTHHKDGSLRRLQVRGLRQSKDLVFDTSSSLGHL